MPVSDIIDLATNQTLARTIMTSLTLLLALGSLYFFGGEVIRSFTAAMIWGIIVATASSIFIGGPILIYFNIRPKAAGAGRGEGRARSRPRPDPAMARRHRRPRCPLSRVGRRSTATAMAGSASPACRIADRSSACRAASTAGMRRPTIDADSLAAGLRRSRCHRDAADRHRQRTSLRSRRRCERGSARRRSSPRRCRPARRCAPSTCCSPRTGRSPRRSSRWTETRSAGHIQAMAAPDIRADIVRAGDRDRYLADLFAPADLRRASVRAACLQRRDGARSATG